MPYSPLVSKIRCNNPNQRKSRILNRNHLVYIATREGVDLTPTQEADNELYLKYINERPRSNGLFGNINCIDPIELGNHLSALTTQNQNVYRGIVSLCEQDAINLGYDTKDSWVSYMKTVMPDIGNQFGIPINNLEWAAAVHMEKTHPHCHFMFWNKEHQVKSPFIHVSIQNQCREILSAEIFRQEREIAIIEKTAIRNLINEMGEESLNENVKFLLYNQIPDRINNSDLNNIADSLFLLSNNLPSSGRLVYKFLPEEQKIMVLDLTKKILEIPSFKREYEKYIELNGVIAKTYSTSQKKEKYILDKATEDIEKRVSNLVLRSCKELLGKRDLMQHYIPQNSYSNNELILPDVEVKEYIDYEDVSYDENDTTSNETYICEWSFKYKSAMDFLYSKEKYDPKAAVNLLYQESLKNNVLAFIELGKLYEKGIGVKKDDATSFQYYEKALKGFQSLLHTDPKKNGYFNYRIGKLYESGKGTKTDYISAIEHYQIAVDDDNKYAQYSLGNMYLREKGIEVTTENKESYLLMALDLFKKSSNQKNAYAAFSYAQTSERYNLHNLSIQDINSYYKNAFSGFLNMLEKSPCDDLEFKIGIMYRDAKGTEKDLEKSYEHLNNAVELKNDNAKYALCDIYLDESSLHYDKQKALVFLTELSEKDIYISKYTAYKLGKILYEERDVPGNLNLSLKYLIQSSRVGNEYADSLLGTIYSNKELETYDIQKAIYHFKKAAEKGSDIAAYKLGKLLYEERDVPGNLRLSIKYLEQSSSTGNEHANYLLGTIYSNKKLEVYNIQKAIYCFNKSIEKNNIFSMYQLGNIYLWGNHKGIKDEKLGMDLLNMAAEGGHPNAEETMNMYKNYKQQITLGIGYQLINDIYKGIVGTKEMSKFNFKNERRFRSKSLEARKESARKESYKEQY